MSASDNYPAPLRASALQPIALITHVSDICLSDSPGRRLQNHLQMIPLVNRAELRSLLTSIFDDVRSLRYLTQLLDGAEQLRTLTTYIDPQGKYK